MCLCLITIWYVMFKQIHMYLPEHDILCYPPNITCVSGVKNNWSKNMGCIKNEDFGFHEAGRINGNEMGWTRAKSSNNFTRLRRGGTPPRSSSSSKFLFLLSLLQFFHLKFAHQEIMRTDLHPRTILQPFISALFHCKVGEWQQSCFVEE